LECCDCWLSKKRTWRKWPLEAGKDKKNRFCSECLEGTQPWWYLDFSPVKPISNSHNRKIINLCCLKPLNGFFIVTRKLMQEHSWRELLLEVSVNFQVDFYSLSSL
jgi:hypothetical protein